MLGMVPDLDQRSRFLSTWPCNCDDRLTIIASPPSSSHRSSIKTTTRPTHTATPMTTYRHTTRRGRHELNQQAARLRQPALVELARKPPAIGAPPRLHARRQLITNLPCLRAWWRRCRSRPWRSRSRQLGQRLCLKLEALEPWAAAGRRWVGGDVFMSISMQGNIQTTEPSRRRGAPSHQPFSSCSASWSDRGCSPLVLKS